VVAAASNGTSERRLRSPATSSLRVSGREAIDEWSEPSCYQRDNRATRHPQSATISPSWLIGQRFTQPGSARMELMAMEDDAVSTRSRLTLSQSGPCARTHRRFDRAVRPKDTWTGVVHTHWCMHKSRALCTALLSICVKCCETRRFEAGCGYAEVMNSNGIIIFLLAQTAESGELGSSIESWTESL
jgi:hypothetical protein